MVLLSENSGLEEGTIIIYHDVNTSGYPCYGNNVQRLSSLFRNNTHGHSIELTIDCMCPYSPIASKKFLGTTFTVMDRH
jgi:hypothetical protein